MNEGMYQLDASQIDALSEAMDRVGVGSGQIVNEYLGGEGAQEIEQNIPGHIHASGRKWKGKAASATSAARSSVFTQKMASELTLEVSSTSRYHYLYFPDDGSNTIHHVGNQQFMLQGAEDASDTIVNAICDRLVAAFEEG